MALAVGATVVRVKRVADAVDVDPRALASWVKRRPARVAALARALDGPSPLAPLARALGEADPRARNASTNEALRDLGAEVAWGEAIPDAALRACAFGTLLAVAAVLIGRVDLGARLVDILVLGGGGALVVLDVRRLSRAYATRWRVALDAWVAASVDPAELAAPSVTPSRRARRKQ